MEMSNTPSPSHQNRRRKKRSTPTSVGPSNASLNGLSKSNIRYVEISRGNMGYGFTISGQKPCLLRCIVEGSPAEAASLRPGNCLVSVNGTDVQHLAHDDVVRMIGSSTGVLRLLVAESYFSESSEDENFQNRLQQRPKYPHKPRVLNKSAFKKGPATTSSDHTKISSKENSVGKSVRPMPLTPNPIPRRSAHTSDRRSTWDPLMPTPRRSSRPPLPVNNFLENMSTPVIPSKKPFASGNSMVEIVSVFGQIDLSEPIPQEKPKPAIPGSSKNIESNERFNTQSSSGSSNRAKNLIGRQITEITSEYSKSSSSATIDSNSMYQAVVVYIGSVELPEVEQRKRLKALSSCIRRVRLEIENPVTVLLQVQPNGICIFRANKFYRNSGKQVAFYSSNVIAFCGAYSDDRRFFGLVTCTGPSKTSSCHVFMVDPDLIAHSDHAQRAQSFGIECTLSSPNNEQVLGLQECTEFPATADPILRSILQLHCSPPPSTPDSERPPPPMNQRPPSEASNRLESTNSSTSDSGIGYRDDPERLSGRTIYKVDRQLLFQKPRRPSPIPKKRLPSSRKQVQPIPQDGKSGSTNLNLGNLPNDFHYPEQTVGVMEFEADPNSMHDILKKYLKDTPPPIPSKRLSTRDTIKDRLSLNPVRSKKPAQPCVLVNPPKVPEKRQRSSMEMMTPISPSRINLRKRLDKINAKFEDGRRLTIPSLQSRSLDNLCSPEVLKELDGQNQDSKETLGSSTPALNQESVKGQADDFWDFKVPQPPKPKMEVSRFEKWAESIEKLLGDPYGLDVFTKFLQGEISAENIHFYTRCLEYKETFPDLTQSQRISKASTIFQCYLQNGATEAINVDCQARNEVEKALSQPTREMFNLPLAQVFDLLKFDCYPRFLRSEMYRDYASGIVSLQESLGDPSDSDQDSVKSHKLHHDERRRSLLPWNKNRSKGKNRNKKEPESLNANISFIQRSLGSSNPSFEGLDQSSESRRDSCRLFRIHLPDNSSTVLSFMPDETILSAINKLLEKRGLSYSSFEVYSLPFQKGQMCLHLPALLSSVRAEELRVEARATVRIELPLGWVVGVRANLTRKLFEVLKPILNQHLLKMDAVVVYDEADQLVEVFERTIGELDGKTVFIKSRDEARRDAIMQARLEDLSNRIPEFDCHRKNSDVYMDDDQSSVKTSSSTSSRFGDFMRKSSKKFKRKAPASAHTIDADCHSQNSRTSEVVVQMHGTERETCAIANRATLMTKMSDDENLQPRRQTLRHNSVPNGVADSPLSLMKSEFKFTEKSRNRNPIYITQSNEQKS